VDYVHSNIFKNPDSQLWQNIALFFSQVANFIPLYFTTANLRDIYTKRAEIIEFSLKNRGCSIDCIFPARSPNRTKIRLGIISDHFAPQTETFATIPVFEHLNRNQFEIYLYALNTSGHQLEQYCQSRADKLVALPKDFASQVQTIRADDLDILFFGTNLTAINKPVASLAIHRLARVQTTSFCSPTTTGIRHMDYYIAGNLPRRMLVIKNNIGNSWLFSKAAVLVSNTQQNRKLLQLNLPAKVSEFPTQQQFLSPAPTSTKFCRS
jgi:predicted O-linked N-acetylglucosamine transferase (SPINDLY family)